MLLVLVCSFPTDYQNDLTWRIEHCVYCVSVLLYSVLLKQVFMLENFVFSKNPWYRERDCRFWEERNSLTDPHFRVYKGGRGGRGNDCCNLKNQNGTFWSCSDKKTHTARVRRKAGLDTE